MIGFHPAQWPLWTIERGAEVAGLCVGGSAPLHGTLRFSLPAARGYLVVHNAGLRALQLAIDGKTLEPSIGSGDTRLDLGTLLRPGVNVVEAQGSAAGDYGSAVLSFFT